ncbi:MAG: hypothetical protein QF535_23745, partial [Anaerolineales bacterium]|nr:hypothetical protein [Anaerolineales bacterium]
NESGADKDFRIEGDTDANLFIADASTDRIGIGTATPDYTLDVAGDISVDDYIYHNGDADTYIGFPGNDKFAIHAGGTNFIKAQQKDNDPDILIFNENQGNVDVKFKAPGQGNLLFLDASEDRIGIGTGSPSHMLDVEGVAHFATCIVTPTVCTTGDTVIDGDLTVSGDDITMGTNTSGHILVADGTNYNPVAVSGDVTISNTGAVTIAATSVENSMLAGSIANAKLANDSVSYGGVSLDLGGTDATPAFNLCDATAYKGDSALVTVGTITSGTWNGTAIASAYLDSDTAHLSGTQTFSGAKTFSAAAQFSNTVTVGVDDTGYDVKFFGATSGRYLLWDESNDRLKLRDNTKVVFGQSNDLEIYHDATDSIIDSSTGKLKVLSDKFRFNNAADSESM